MYNKYLKYKRKYLTLKNKIGGNGINLNDDEWNQQLVGVQNNFDIIKNENRAKLDRLNIDIHIDNIDKTLSSFKQKQKTDQLNGNIVMCSINEHFFNIIEIMINIIDGLNSVRIYKITEIHLKNPEEYVQDNEVNDINDRIEVVERQIRLYKDRIVNLIGDIEHILGVDYNNVDYNNVVYNNDVNVPILERPLVIDNYRAVYRDITILGNQFLDELDIELPRRRERLVEFNKEEIRVNHAEDLHILRKNINLSEITFVMFEYMYNMLDIVNRLEIIRYEYQYRFSVMSAPVPPNDLHREPDRIERLNEINLVNDSIRNQKNHFIEVFNRFKAIIRQP